MKNFKRILLFLAVFASVLSVGQTDRNRAWRTTGNNALTYSLNFLGTTDNKSVLFKTNNVQRFKIDSAGAVYSGGAGTASASNVYYGKDCGTAGDAGIENAVFGNNTAKLKVLGNGNTYVGAVTARSFTNGGQNCVFGSDALSQNINGSNNCVVGVQSANTFTGSYINTFGTRALQTLLTGSFNIGFGSLCMQTYTNGSKNTFLGCNMGGQTSGSGNTYIGANITPTATALSNNIMISDGDGNVKYRNDGTTNMLFGNVLFDSPLTISRMQDANVSNLSINSGTANTNAFQYTTDFSGLLVGLNSRNGYSMSFMCNDVERMRLSTTALTVADNINIAVGTTNGSRIGTATTQKLGFFNATPVVQQTATSDLGTALSNLGLRAAGTAYPLTTSGAIAFSGAFTSSGAFSSTNFKSGYVAKTALYTITNSDYLIDCTSGTFAVTLPTAASATAGRMFVVKNSGAGSITLTGNGAELIDAANTFVVATTKCVTVMSTGTKYIIVSQY